MEFSPSPGKGSGVTESIFKNRRRSSPNPIPGGYGKFDVLISEKTGASWGTPTVLPTGIDNPHYYLSMNYDGNTIAFASYPTNIFSESPEMFVITRTNGVWNTPVKVSSESSSTQPSLNYDGTRLAWIQSNNQVVVSGKNNGVWGSPSQLTNFAPQDPVEVENPVITPEGSSIFFWQADLSGKLLPRITQA